MQSPVLATKFHAPPRRVGLVARLRLLEKLRAGLQEGSKLTLVSAPAGYGKTTLVAEWLANLQTTIEPPYSKHPGCPLRKPTMNLRALCAIS